MNLETLRIILFCSLFCLFFILERVKPSYQHQYKERWGFNFILLLLSTLAMRFTFPSGLAVMATKIPTQPWHISNWPFEVNLLLTLLIFDFAIYWQHRFSHRWRWFWRFHAVHHSDVSLDVSSGFRFHPGEILISGGYKLALILIIGPSLETFLIYEIVLSSFALFNHSNLKINHKFERWLRYLFVTPQMHYPHHSPQKNLTNSNYGNFLSIWDRLFKTYTSAENHDFGLDNLSGLDKGQNLLYPFNKA